MHWNGSDPNPSELVALLLGVKLIVYGDAGSEDLIAIRKLADFFGWHCDSVPDGAGALARTYGGVDRKDFVLARDPEVLRRGLALLRKPAGRGKGRDWFKLLGYPACCVKAQSKFEASRFVPDSPDSIALTYGRSESAGPFSFHMNNVFNFNGMSVRQRAGEMGRLNRDLYILKVVPWQPCSYSCAASLAAGEKIWGFLKLFFPDYARGLRETLASPILYFNKYEFMVFNGKADSPESISYTGVRPPHSLLARSRLDLIRRGNQVSLHGGRVIVRRGASLLGSFRRPGALLLRFA